MNDIGLLITSALATGHPSVPYLFNEIAVEFDLSLKESNQIQSTALLTPARITPPEFIQPSRGVIASTIVSPKNEHVLRKIRNRINSPDCCSPGGRSISATKEPIILKKSPDSVEESSRIILPSTSPPSLTDPIENTPQLQEVFAGAPNEQQRRINSGRVILGKTGSIPILSFGTFGLSVRVLQRLLLANGYPIRVDGNFGALTETAVKAFQSNRNLTTDGVVGQQTWQELTR
ncbi:MAG: peptidoglycan-binding domain-containing protein [Cyanobacteria bacterium P01_D01_bin.50]